MGVDKAASLCMLHMAERLWVCRSLMIILCHGKFIAMPKAPSGHVRALIRMCKTLQII